MYTSEKTHIDKENADTLKNALKHMFLMYMHILSRCVFSKVYIMCTRWMWNLIPHLMSV